MGTRIPQAGHSWQTIHKAYQCKHCPALYPAAGPCPGPLETEEDRLKARLAKMREDAESPKKYDRMVTMFSNVESKEQLDKAALLYIMDMSYARADISLAIKRIETERGWE